MANGINTVNRISGQHRRVHSAKKKNRDMNRKKFSHDLFEVLDESEEQEGEEDHQKTKQRKKDGVRKEETGHPESRADNSDQTAAISQDNTPKHRIDIKI